MGFECQHLRKVYPTHNGNVPALDDVTFGVGEEEFVSIIGPSGCGKTTLLKLIAGLVKPTAGQVVFDAHLPAGRLRCAMAFQEHGLFPWMNVLDNAAFGLEARGVEPREARERARAFIEKVGLASFAKNYPHELSVGMRQRVAIARAFVADPQILLMDEPFGALDAQTRLVLQEELLEIWKINHKTVVYVTHDIEEALLLGDRVLVMSGRPGRIREEFPVPLPRPRSLSARDHPQISEIKWHIWKILEEEVRANLWITI